MSETPLCLVCQGMLTLFGPSSDYTYYRCTGCGTIQLSPMPNQTQLEHAYQTEYASGKQLERYDDPDWYRGVSLTYRASIVNALNDHDVTGTVVDCGAGWGFLVEMMTENGFDARGVELSHDQVVYARQRGLAIQQGGLDSVEGMEGQVSAITLSCVFEHLVDHTAVLSVAHRLLNDDGLLVTLHPTARFFNLVGNLVRLGDKRKPLPDLEGAFAAPWHTALFSIDATRRLISRHGFRLLEIRPAPQGRLGGLVGLIQMSLELLNKIGWRLLRLRWPLITSYIFIFQKVPTSGAVVGPVESHRRVAAIR